MTNHKCNGIGTDSTRNIILIKIFALKKKKQQKKQLVMIKQMRYHENYHAEKCTEKTNKINTE